MLMAVGPLAELAVSKAINRALREQVNDAEAITGRRTLAAYSAGVKHGRVAALGWLLVGALSGFISALAIGFLVFW